VTSELSFSTALLLCVRCVAEGIKLSPVQYALGSTCVFRTCGMIEGDFGVCVCVYELNGGNSLETQRAACKLK
jgi:hypothetical protein